MVFGLDLQDSVPQQTMGDDTAQSARLAAHHLITRGQRRIAHLSYAGPEYRSVSQCEQGWRTALEAHGLTADPAWVAYADVSAQSGYEATRELLSRRVPFTARFTGNDSVTFGALWALSEAGLRVPQDVAVVGYHDIPLAQFRPGQAPLVEPAEPPRLMVSASCEANFRATARPT